MKSKRQLATLKSIRKTWGFDPTSRVVPNKRKYTRKNRANNKNDHERE